ncbi:RNA polymerase alpha subunit C-terminal domain-containing protein [Paenibacillus polysaccharolyticus]|uniref:RNA polymerase alpha subunit C-terminal domain-containing protein n=1 Tax=Paenibacillus polysaccharolyticus TaxID=582692 RepID=UPI00209F7CF8|nr:RNA polymerase alpha subunit C-terminal domain-containing protein [Paenibacillus polysaccharolyticus]MCP1135197.1 RNA polymerase alpha subunit C-terminal domain-containing protein [Paenibacillus polysaccharolyticus]
MTTNKGTRRTCEKGHTFFKKSDCSTCPKCEAERKPKEGFMSLLSAPVRRALEAEDITTLPKLAEYTEKEILKLHGIGPSSMPILRKSLEEEGLSFKV